MRAVCGLDVHKGKFNFLHGNFQMAEIPRNLRILPNDLGF